MIQANTDTTSNDGKVSIAKDVNKLLEQLNNIAVQTNYNGTSLLQAGRGSANGTKGLSFQVGENRQDLIKTKTIQANSTGLGLTTLKTKASAAAAGTGGAIATNFGKTIISATQLAVDKAITKLNGYRGEIGSTQNQVESAVRNLMTQSTNVKAAESIIRDVDYAKESANFNKQNIISQAGSYAISQANTVQQNVLKLLQ